jgi:hypothetical protein
MAAHDKLKERFYAYLIDLVFGIFILYFAVGVGLSEFAFTLVERFFGIQLYQYQNAVGETLAVFWYLVRDGIEGDFQTGVMSRFFSYGKKVFGLRVITTEGGLILQCKPAESVLRNGLTCFFFLGLIRLVSPFLSEFAEGITYHGLLRRDVLTLFCISFGSSWMAADMASLFITGKTVSDMLSHTRLISNTAYEMIRQVERN